MLAVHRLQIDHLIALDHAETQSAVCFETNDLHGYSLTLDRGLVAAAWWGGKGARSGATWCMPDVRRCPRNRGEAEERLGTLRFAASSRRAGEEMRPQHLPAGQARF